MLIRFVSYKLFIITINDTAKKYIRLSDYCHKLYCLKNGSIEDGQEKYEACS